MNLNLLLVSNSYASVASSAWSHAYGVSMVIALISIALSILFLICYCNSNTKKSESLFTVLTFISLIFMVICVIFNAGNSTVDINSALNQSPQAISSLAGYNNNYYSKYTIPHVVRIIHHNQKILPYKWSHDEYLIHHIGTRPSHDHVIKFKNYTLAKTHQVHYQAHLLQQVRFDKRNAKYCTKKYVKLPRWYNYL